MYAHGANARAHIPQPPHSAGEALKGFRAHIEPHQVPSPVDAIEHDRTQWESQPFMTLPDNHAPLSTTDYFAIDQGNSSPRFVRLSTWALPNSSRLAEELDIPLYVIIQPFAEPDLREEPVPIIDFGPDGPPRCEQCKGYINPWCTWTAEGQRWKCNLCGHETSVGATYYSPLDAHLLRLDHPNRPELQRGTIDFVVTDAPTYWARHPPARLAPSYVSPPAPPLLPSSSSPSVSPETPPDARPPTPLPHLFALDISQTSLTSGFLRSSCDALLRILYGGIDEEGNAISPSFPNESSFGLITFDSSLQFHDLSPDLPSTNILIMSDIDEPFIPLYTGLFASPIESRPILEPLLQSIPARHQGTLAAQTCLGSVMRAALAALSRLGGHLVVFQATRPALGPGALPFSPSLASSSNEPDQPFTPLDPDGTWRSVGEEMAECGVGVSMFLGVSEEAGISSISLPTTITGGSLFFHPRFNPVHDAPVLASQLQWLVTRTAGYNCDLRLRTSSGLRVSQAYGAFLSTGDTYAAGVLNTSSTFALTLKHTSTLPTTAPARAYLQSAVLHTTPAGQRRVRVHNTAVQVVELAGSVFRYADMEAVLAGLTRHALERVTTHKASVIRDELTETCAAILYAYRRNCAASTAATQLIIPEAFRSLPMYTLGMHKSKPLKARSVSQDVRAYTAHRLLGAPVRHTMYHLYPRLLAIHDLDDTIALPDPKTGVIEMPSLMRGSYKFMEAGGIYLVDNEEMQVLWVGQSVSPHLLQDVFGVDDIVDVDPQMSRLPHLDTRLSAQIRNILAHREAERGGRRLRLRVARQNLDAAEIEFSDMLIEDTNNAALSYIDYLSLVHKQIASAIQSGSSLGSGGFSIRAPW